MVITNPGWNKTVKTRLHCSNSNSPLPTVGSIPFTIRNRKLDYFKSENQSLFRLSDWIGCYSFSFHHHVSLPHKMNGNSYSETVFILKPRTETLLEIAVRNPEIKGHIVTKCEISKAYYIYPEPLTSLTQITKHYAVILNTGVMERELSCISVKVEMLPKTASIM